MSIYLPIYLNSNDSNQVFKKKHPRTHFSSSEDDLLKNLVEKYGTQNWVKISQQIQGRNPRQCRDRWLNYLSPNVKNGPWSSEEDELLLIKYNEYGPSWKKIASFFPTRTDINIRSRWQLKERRQKKENLLMAKEIFQNKKKNHIIEHLPQFSQNDTHIYNQHSIQVKNIIKKDAEKHIPAINSTSLPFSNEENDFYEANFEIDYDFQDIEFDCMSSLLMNEENENITNDWF